MYTCTVLYRLTYLLVGGDQFEGGGHLAGGGSAAHVEEVSGRASVQLDDVHR